jgi:hypothetical protein
MDYIPKPGQGQPVIPGEPLQPSWPDELSSGVSQANLTQFQANLTDYYAKLAAWEKARQDVEAQIAAILSWAEVANTLVNKILPQVLALVKAIPQSTPQTAGLSGILTQLPSYITQITALINQVKTSLPGLP